jgi:hypothetical protein
MECHRAKMWVTMKKGDSPIVLFAQLTKLKNQYGGNATDTNLVAQAIAVATVEYKRLFSCDQIADVSRPGIHLSRSIFHPGIHTPIHMPMYSSLLLSWHLYLYLSDITFCLQAPAFTHLFLFTSHFDHWYRSYSVYVGH